MNRTLLFAFATVGILGCASSDPVMKAYVPRPHPEQPSYDELARAEPAAFHRALVVVYPRSHATGTARTVFVDDRDAFLGALGPGEGSILVVPVATRNVRAFSSIEVSAHRGAWFIVDEIPVPAEPNAYVVRGYGQYAEVWPTSKASLEAILADHEIRWMAPVRERGEAWFDHHRARVDELLGRNDPPSSYVTRALRSGRGVRRTHVP